MPSCSLACKQVAVQEVAPPSHVARFLRCCQNNMGTGLGMYVCILKQCKAGDGQQGYVCEISAFQIVGCSCKAGLTLLSSMEDIRMLLRSSVHAGSCSRGDTGEPPAALPVSVPKSLQTRQLIYPPCSPVWVSSCLMPCISHTSPPGLRIYG